MQVREVRSLSPCFTHSAKFEKIKLIQRKCCRAPCYYQEKVPGQALRLSIVICSSAHDPFTSGLVGLWLRRSDLSSEVSGPCQDLAGWIDLEVCVLFTLESSYVAHSSCKGLRFLAKVTECFSENSTYCAEHVGAHITRSATCRQSARMQYYGMRE